MTEYWKSQARKYCEFCKCWFADNKVSISFHENGKKHKESVQKHISTLTKKSTKDAKQKEKIDDEMKKMEMAAMAAYLKDVQKNADLTSQAINGMLSSGPDHGGSSSSEALNTSSSAPKKPLMWQEVKSDGPSYFWNVETNETTWDPPDEYLSLAQQEENKMKEETAEKRKQKLKKEKQKEAVKEAKSFAAREQMKELSVKKDKPKPVEGRSFGPAPRVSQPYGTWTAVVNEPIEKVDLQLPKSTKEVIPPAAVLLPEPRAQFAERRTPAPAADDTPVEFKKRKLGGARRNMRQKLDDD